jgi:RHS repeat-associated protein
MENRMIWSCTATGVGLWMLCTSETYFFYAPGGKLLAQFTPVYTLAYRDQQYQNHPATFAFLNTANTRAYFGGRMLGAEDRLGSRGKYFPYGDDRSNPPPANDQVKFATYTRDSATGLDYADQRYYASTYGRFVSPDPYMASGGPADPLSWNRYAYVGSDPINFYDPEGLFQACPPGTHTSADAHSCVGSIGDGAAVVGQAVGSGFANAMVALGQVTESLPSMLGPLCPKALTAPGFGSDAIAANVKAALGKQDGIVKSLKSLISSGACGPTLDITQLPTVSCGNMALTQMAEDVKNFETPVGIVY